MSYFPQQLTHKIQGDPANRVMVYRPMTDEEFEVMSAAGRRATRGLTVGEDDESATRARAEITRAHVAQVIDSISGVDSVADYLKQAPRLVFLDISATVYGANLLSDAEGKS